MSTTSWFSITESRYDIFNNTAWKYIRCASQTKTGDKKDFEGKKKVIWYWWKSQEEIKNQRWRNKFWKWGSLFLFESWTKQSLTEIQFDRPIWDLPSEQFRVKPTAYGTPRTGYGCILTVEDNIWHIAWIIRYGLKAMNDSVSS